MPFRNPVYPHSFPDPFVLKYRGEYWGYCTGIQPDGRAFGIIRSPDLAEWHEVGSAMDALPPELDPAIPFTCYWAPEITCEDDGSFLMYYSVGDEQSMSIRVAKADRPEGPFVDTGHKLTREQFAIDAHVFKDDDGARYLFYATDFLSYSHIGTGTVCDRMLDPFTLQGNPKPVTRAKYDWHVYDPKRENKGGVRWHTIEGPFVLKRKHRYFEMYSGGNWQNLSYGVSFAVSEVLRSDEEWTQHADGEKILPILRTIPGKLIGPGHNSVVVGPDNRQLFIIYHLWSGGERVLAIDRMEIVGDTLSILGPTIDGHLPSAESLVEPTFPIAARTQLIGIPEKSDRGPDSSILRDGTFEEIDFGGKAALVVLWAKFEDGATLRLVTNDQPWREFSITFVSGKDLPPNIWIPIRIEFDGTFFKLHVGENIRHEESIMPSPTSTVRFEALGADVHLTPIAITRGFQDLMDGDEGSNDLTERGWDFDDGGWNLEANNEPTDHNTELRYRPNRYSSTTGFQMLRKTITGIRDFELVVTMKLDNTVADTAAAVIVGEPENDVTVRLQAVQQAGRIEILQAGAVVSSFLPDPPIDPFAYQQIRILQQNGRLHIALGIQHLADLDIPPHTSIALGAKGSAAFDMVRLTEIPTTD